MSGARSILFCQIALFFLFPASLYSQHTSIWSSQVVNKHVDVFNTNPKKEFKDVTLYFTAEWCGACQIVKSEIIPTLPKNSVYIVDIEKESEIWEKYSRLINRENSIPVAVYIGEDGKWKRWVAGAGKSGGPGDYRLDKKGFEWLRTGVREEDRSLTYKEENVNVQGRAKRILVFTLPGQNWIEPSAHDKLLKSGWKVGISPQNHVQIIYDKDQALKYGLTEETRFATLENGEIVRQFEIGCGMELDQWAIGWLYNGNKNNAERIAQAPITKINRNYPLRGNWWTVDGQSRPTKQYIIDHLRMSPNHRGKPFQNWNLQNFSYEELQSIHSDDHEGRLRNLLKKPAQKGKISVQSIARPKAKRRPALRWT